MDARYRLLEEKLTFVEHQVQQLDGVVRELGDGLVEVADRLTRLARHVERDADTPPGASDSDDPTPPGPGPGPGPTNADLENDRPPHW